MPSRKLQKYVYIYIYACAASTHTASQTRINPRNASKVKSRNYRGTLTRRAGRNPFDNETRFLEREISKEETCFLRGEKKKKKEIVTKDAALSLSQRYPSSETHM